MKNILFFLMIVLVFTNCQSDQSGKSNTDSSFNWQVDEFKDIRVLRYQIPGFDRLSLDQKKLVYFLTEAGLCGRDIMYDMNYRHNIKIRKALETIIDKYDGDRTTDDWQGLETYAKRVWFANGIHHHYSMDKMIPDCSPQYFARVCQDLNIKMPADVLNCMFDPQVDNKKVNLNPEIGLLKGSAVNFYDPDVTAEEVEAFYKEKSKNDGDTPIWHGLNSKIVRNDDGSISESVYSLNGMYGSAIKEIISWLEKATTVAENDAQEKALKLLIEYYKTGDLKTWDEYNVAWVEATEGDIDYINSFIEVYNDPMGYKGSYESIVEIKDFDASERMAVLAENAQWFEDNSTIRDEHKKANVVGVSYKVVSVAGESGDASPATPIGVNLPNSPWIRKNHGSKSVSLGNIIDAYSKASGSGLLEEFAHDKEEVAVIKKYGELGDKMSTALHEVIGHASGQINPGIGTPKQTLKSYASTIEEARADIVALYFIMDQKMIDIGLLPSLDVAKAEYDGYISNGMMKQLQRIELGKDIEESHMRNRQLICKWAYERGQDENVIEKVVREGKTYFNITDYNKLRVIFGELLTELQRLTSEGDYQAGKDLVENYGVKVDRELHEEVLRRCEPLKVAPYSGFVNPELKAVTNDDGKITDIVVEQPKDFVTQMMDYGKKYSFLK